MIICSCAPSHSYLDETGKESSIKKSTVFENRDKWIYLDQNGKRITAEEYQQKWRNNENNLVRHDYIAKDTGRVATLFEPIYSRYVVKYIYFSKKLEEITGQEFSANTIFLLDYTYVNDLCSSSSTNLWSKHVINNRKQFTTPNKKAIEKRNPEIVIINFFEIGISLKNSPTSKKEYYFQDSENFLRRTIFLHPSLCGSFALIKPNGETLVRNGEYNADLTEQHLKPENWDQFFPPSE